MSGKEEDKNKEREEDKGEIDFGAGKISFSGLFKGLGNLIDLAEKLEEEGVERRGAIGSLPRRATGVYGLSVRTLGGKSVIERFGNIRETAKGPTVEDVREPFVDIFDENDHVLVIAELPGVAEETIKVEVTGDILNLSASGTGRKYAKEILLPGVVKPSSLKTSYKNGMLEIRLDKE